MSTDYAQLGASAQVEVAFAVAAIDGNGTADLNFLGISIDYR